MKTLTILSMLVLLCTSCATMQTQELRQEREELLTEVGDVREKHHPDKVKNAIKALLLGKWQYVSLEVEGGSIEKQKEDAPQESEAPTSADGQVTPNELLSESEDDALRLPPVRVTDNPASQQIAEAKAAMVASTRKNLTVEFFEQHSSYYYRGNNGSTDITGQCNVITMRVGDESYPFIRFNRRTGLEMLEFLFGYEPARNALARSRRAVFAKRRSMGAQGSRRALAKAPSFAIASTMGIAVTEDRLYLIIYGDMELTPKGWMRTGGLRCTLKRVE